MTEAQRIWPVLNQARRVLAEHLRGNQDALRCLSALDALLAFPPKDNCPDCESYRAASRRHRADADEQSRRNRIIGRQAARVEQKRRDAIQEAKHLRRQRNEGRRENERLWNRLRQLEG